MKLTTKQILLLSGLLVFSVVVLFSSGDLLLRAGALGGLMIFLWFFDVIPMYVTAMLPLALGVPMGLLTAEDLADSYADKFVFLFLGGFILALAMEKWDVHKQLAHSIIHIVGSSKSRILLGFILSTGVISMWISNTATTVMMLPMVLAVIKNLEHEENSRFPRFLLLSIAYAASIGGMATLVGSPPNSIMAGYLHDVQGIDVSFVDWMKIGMPVSILLLTGLYFFFIWRLRGEKNTDKIRVDIEKKPWSTDQIRVILLFVVVILMWSFRTLILSFTKDFLPSFTYGDEHIAILGAIVLFILPSTKGEPMLIWTDTNKLPWGILLLFGGGLAMAKMLETNGVIVEIAGMFEHFGTLHISVILLVVVSIAIFGTEFMSNTALVSVFIPVIATFALKAEIPLETLCIPVTLAASCAFMLPIGTPPNAIVFSGSDLTIKQMAATGFVLNVICTFVIVAYALLFL